MNWLLLRGLMRDQRHFMDFPESLRRSVAPGCVVCLDAPGLGTERGRRSPSDVPAIMRDIRGRFVDQRATVPGPWAIFGISLGGMVALAWADEFPDDFEHVVVANTSARDVGSTFERARPGAIATFARIAATRDPFERESLVLGISSNAGTDLADVARTWASFVPRGAFAHGVALAQLRAASRYAAPARLDVPVTVFGSTRDRLVDVRCSESIATRFGATFHRHDSAGHDLPLDAGGWLIERIASIR